MTIQAISESSRPRPQSMELALPDPKTAWSERVATDRDSTELTNFEITPNHTLRIEGSLRRAERRSRFTIFTYGSWQEEVSIPEAVQLETIKVQMADSRDHIVINAALNTS